MSFFLFLFSIYRALICKYWIPIIAHAKKIPSGTDIFRDMVEIIIQAVTILVVAVPEGVSIYYSFIFHFPSSYLFLSLSLSFSLFLSLLFHIFFLVLIVISTFCFFSLFESSLYMWILVAHGCYTCFSICYDQNGERRMSCSSIECMVYI